MQRLISQFQQNNINHIWNLFSSTVFLVYTWSICIVLWDFPALLLKYNFFDIAGYIAYQLTFALIESVLITFFVITVSFILPAKFLRNNLSVRGSILVLCIGLVTVSYRLLPIIIQKIINTFPGLDSTFIFILIFGLWIFLVFNLLFFTIKVCKSKSVSQFMMRFLERLSTLAGLYIFLSLCSFLIVIIRNIK